MQRNGRTQTRSMTPLEKLARERVLERLTEAKSLLRRGLARNADRVAELLEDARDRLEAARVVSAAFRPQSPPREAAPAGSRWRTCVAALRAEFGKPVSEFLLIPYGDVEVERPLSGRSFRFEPAHAEAAVRWFEALGRKLAIDYEHQSFDAGAARMDGLRPAAGWIGGLEAREDGLWATKVEWTARATALLAGGEYRYFSPVIFWADEEYTQLVGLGPVALTNDPAMHGVQALAAGREPSGMPVQNLGHASPSTQSHPHGLLNEDASTATLASELARAQGEIEELKQQLAAQEADAFVERGMRLGKILDSTSMDWRSDYARDPALAEQRLSRAPVLRPPGRIVSKPLMELAMRSGAVVPEGLRKVGIEPADLEAYERALAAGRVRVTK